MSCGRLPSPPSPHRVGAPLCRSEAMGMTTAYFGASSLILNGLLTWKSWQFYRSPNEKTARSLFHVSIIHLPVLIALFMLHRARQGASNDEVEGEAVIDAAGVIGAPVAS